MGGADMADDSLVVKIRSLPMGGLRLHADDTRYSVGVLGSRAVILGLPDTWFQQVAKVVSGRKVLLEGARFVDTDRGNALVAVLGPGDPAEVWRNPEYMESLGQWTAAGAK